VVTGRSALSEQSLTRTMYPAQIKEVLL